MKKKLIIICSSIFSVILIIVIAFAIYVNDYYHAEKEAYLALESNNTVEVVDGKGMYTFIPDNYTSGIIFYPGGKVEAISYAPLMMELAKKYGYLCILIEMPFNLAVFDVNAADKIIDNYDNVNKWYMAGHSLGGSMAASYISKNKEAFSGLILLGAYSTIDLSDTSFNIISIYRENDNVMNKDKYNSCLSNLPTNYHEEIITGGNHAYFGMYGNQAGDGKAIISNEEQIEQAADIIYKFIQ